MRVPLTRALLLILVVVAVPSSAAPARSAAPTGTDVVLLAGQSNMVGRGTGADAPGAATPDERVRQWDPARGIVAAVDPLVHQGPGTAVGPGLTFGKAYARRLPADRDVLLVGAAYGGTSIVSGRWKPGGDLFEGAVARANAAMAAAGPGARFAGILWHQGESDVTQGGADAYRANLDAVLAAFRSRITGAGATTPFVVGEFAPQWVAANESTALRTPIRTVLGVFHTLPDRQPHTAWVSSAGLTSNTGDPLHLDAFSQRELGRRYAARFAEAAAGLPQPEVDVRAYRGVFHNIGASTLASPRATVTGVVATESDPVRGTVARVARSAGSLTLTAPPALFDASYTKVVWVRLASYGWRHHLSSGEGGTQAHYLYFPNGGDTVGAGHGRPGEVRVAVRGSDPVPLDTWVQIAVTYDGPRTTMTLYVNGRPVSVNAAVPAPPAAAATALQFSGYGDRAGFGLDGRMVDPRVYDRALSAGQVATLYRTESGGRPGW